jgi:Beige/BEACH domain/PH domain associated with Beige/BEACH/Concanavalin A-like lectin/glucanases superfamily/WD domain, G-beta repeat
MERAITQASRSFGEGVQSIVASAKAKQQAGAAGAEWKSALLKLLGQAPVMRSAPNRPQPPTTKVKLGTQQPLTPKTDIDILIQNMACDKFVVRCVENELPPNLVHCLRLLRVLELQHANTYQIKQMNGSTGSAANGADSDDDMSRESVGTSQSSSGECRPIGKLATKKVTKLLCRLCTDTAVGEQLRPHLFGLLALSGASYPPTGIHVAAAASDVICQFAKHCFTRNLVWFIHDRKMMIHMTDDVKELSGMMSGENHSQASQAVVPMGLNGADAEASGLIVVALRTVVKMVHESIRFDTVDIVKDFEAAGGYDVVQYCMLNATGPNGKALLELLPMLACCPNEILVDSDCDDDIQKLASNFRIFDMLADLLTRSNPLLRKRRKAADDKKNFVDLTNPGDLNDLALESIQIAASVRLETMKETVTFDDDLDVKYDLQTELLAITLQLFADHPNNYEVVEERLHVLTYSLLSFPCFTRVDTKIMVMKTLEMVLTGTGPGSEMAPVTACIEIFFSLCRTLTIGDLHDGSSLPVEDKRMILDLFAADASLMGSTLEKLLEFDQRVAPVMVESGIMITRLQEWLNLVASIAEKRTPMKEVGSGDEMKQFPPEATPQDKTFGIVCRVLSLLVLDQPGIFAVDDVSVANGDDAIENDKTKSKYKKRLKKPKERTYLHVLLRVGIKELGVAAASDAASVFEAYMGSFSSAESLNQDMKFVMKFLSYTIDLVKLTDRDAAVLQRLNIIISMLRNVLESKSLARHSFRTCKGFEAILKIILALRDVAPSLEGNEPLSQAVMETLQTVFSLLEAAIGMKSKGGGVGAIDSFPLSIRADISVDNVSSQLSSQSASSLNRNFLRQSGFYLNLGAVLSGTGLTATPRARSVLNLALGHMDPALAKDGDLSDVNFVRNPDAVRLGLAMAMYLPDSRIKNEEAIRILDTILRLCENDRVSTTLPQLASCGLSFSLTNPKEFGPLLFDNDHALRSRFAGILSRIAACNMSYMDFVGVLRNIVGPILQTEGSDGRVRLPVISSSIRKSATVQLLSDLDRPSRFEEQEQDFSQRLDCVCEMAKTGDCFARIKVGGDTVNTIAVLMHKVPLEEKLRATAEEGRLRYIEVESVDASAALPDAATSAVTTTSSIEKLWGPLNGSGFTFSLWLRHDIPVDSSSGGNIHILDLCGFNNGTASSANQNALFLSLWYDLQQQRFNVMSSASYRGEPTSFPVSPLQPEVWHHVLVTYTPAKRAMIARKSVFCIYVDGRPLEAEVRVDSVSLPPKSRFVIGAPNPTLAMTGVVRGVLPVWEVGPTLLLSTVLLDLDATAVYAYGPGFPGLLWGDRPQRLSLSATGTAMFSMLANVGETGSIASALRRRDIPRLEAAGYSSMGHTEQDDLSSLNLLCTIPPESVIFGFQSSSVLNKMQNEALKPERPLPTERLVNLARLNYGSELVSTDAVVYGKGTIVAPVSFRDCLRWVGGPSVLMPVVNAANTSATLALALQMIRLGTVSHRPNLEMLQAGGGYRMLSVLLQGKGILDERCLDQCLAFAIYGFEPDPKQLPTPDDTFGGPGTASSVHSNGSAGWVFADLDAMKHLLLNHQVWDLKKYGPRVPLRLLTVLNRLVDHRAIHKSFNARRLHQVGIVRWSLHLAIEAAELYTAAERHSRRSQEEGGVLGGSNIWHCECPGVAEVSVGGDPGNPFLLECKNLLRRVLTFMLTPGDLEALVESIVFTISIGGKNLNTAKEEHFSYQDRMLPGSTMRLHLVRLLEELIVDGVNEIVAAARTDHNAQQEVVVPHMGGIASPNQPYFTTSSTRGRKPDGSINPKHQQAQNFLSAFASFLTPAWFATVLEGCEEEASSCALLRLLILMLQGSASFESVFRSSGAFSPFVLSIPRYSTCPGIAIAMLSQLLNVPILHLHSLPSLDAEQLCEVFDVEGQDPEFDLNEMPADPSSGIFALLVECIGRNVQLVASKSDVAPKAAATNQAIVQLLAHRHSTSPSFREFCRSLVFLEPLSQALCLVYDEKLQPVRVSKRSKRYTLLTDVPKDLTPTERFVGSPDDPDSTGMGIVRLIKMIMYDAILSVPRAAQTVYSIFRSFPIHASPQQVEAFHLVLIEQCCSVIDSVLRQGEGDPMAIANCLGVCSVFLDHEAGGFFTSEAALKTVKTIVTVLHHLLKYDTPAVYSIPNAEHSMLTRDAAFLANLACVTALRASLPYNDHDRGDDDLQAAVLELLDLNIECLLLLPPRDRKSNWKVPTGKATKPSPNAKNYDVWESASIARCPLDRRIFFPDYYAVENPDLVFIAPLLVCLRQLLLGARDDVKSFAVSIFVALLQNRSTILTELLVAEVKRSGGRVDTIDVVNRGGFKALLTAHEAATVADEKKKSSLSVKRKYSSFFDWFEKNQTDVQLVFDEIDKKGDTVFPGLQQASIPQIEAVETEQKLMLMRLSSRSADRTMLGGLERAELARICYESTSEIHSQWKRQGFDDLAYGAMKWKVLLRQLKGSSSIWEGGPRHGEDKSIALKDRLKLLDAGDFSCLFMSEPPELVKRWKLDLTEGYERQRRRLLPNYEFHGLYNLDEEQDVAAVSDTPESLASRAKSKAAAEVAVVAEFLGGGQMEATAELLKDLKIKRTSRGVDDELDDTEADAATDDAMTEATTVSSVTNDHASISALDEKDTEISPDVDMTEEQISPLVPADVLDSEVAEEKDSSSYELITGLLQAGDWPEKSFNVRRCTGLEVTKALLLWCGNAIYVIDGFEQTGGDGMEGKISRVERERSSFHINLRPKGFKVNTKEMSDDEVLASHGERSSTELSVAKREDGIRAEHAIEFETTSQIIYEHRSQRILLTDLYSVYRRRYQLQQSALEFYDVNRNSALIAFDSHTEREEVLSKVLQANIPNSIFSSNYGTYINYTKFMRNLKAKIISQWQNGKMTNFEFIMQLNSLAGRSFNDLTQYPVFPWVIADYESEELDLDDPKTYRDLSKPMGAIGEERAQQFRDRYEALASTCNGEDDPPPFHYGTHYSCAAYVLYYLMRLEPFSRLALALQGGRFDVADRLFHDVGKSWRSASCENLQDVRELIPEFYYLPDFLVNTNHFDFGETQRGKTVHDVSLPKWARDDPKRFVRINRQALESEYVSKNLHHWIDLVFGFKQRGEEAVRCLNTFVHVTYEGEVDIDAMSDPIQRQSTIAQIQNFGQTPSRLERTPFAQRTVAKGLKAKSIDFGALPSLAALTPPLCVVGAPQRVHVKFFQSDTCKLGLHGQTDKSVGDINYVKGQVLACGRMCTLVVPSKKYFRFGGINNGISVHAAAVTTRYREANKIISIHDDLHRGPISAAKSSLNGNWLVTGSVDSTIRVWAYDGTLLRHRATLCGHDGSHIKCIDVSTACGVIVSGCGQGRVLLWDLRTLTFIRPLRHPKSVEGEPVVSVSINHKTGNIVTLVGDLLSVFDVNGNLLAHEQPGQTNPPTCAASTDCPEWMDHGIVAVTGHQSGDVRLWSIDFDSESLIRRGTVEGNPHSNPITALRVTGTDRQDVLLIGDAAGRVSVCKTAQLDGYSQEELGRVVAELTATKQTSAAGEEDYHFAKL